MELEGVHFEVGIIGPKAETDEDKEEAKKAIKEFSIKLKEAIESNLKDAEVKKWGEILNYRTKKYSALVSNTGGFIRSIERGLISEADLIFVQSILAPLFQNISNKIILHPHLMFRITGDFKEILKKCSVERQFKKIDKNIDVSHSGIILTFLENNIPIELQITPKIIDVGIYYCNLFNTKEKVTEIQLDLPGKIAFIKNKLGGVVNGKNKLSSP